MKLITIALQKLQGLPISKCNALQNQEGETRKSSSMMALDEDET
jgi:hypothetical protein